MMYTNKINLTFNLNNNYNSKNDFIDFHIIIVTIYTKCIYLSSDSTEWPNESGISK